MLFGEKYSRRVSEHTFLNCKLVGIADQLHIDRKFTRYYNTRTLHKSIKRMIYVPIQLTGQGRIYGK
jgi:hypothetical protein